MTTAAVTVTLNWYNLWGILVDGLIDNVEKVASSGKNAPQKINTQLLTKTGEKQ